MVWKDFDHGTLVLTTQQLRGCNDAIHLSNAARPPDRGLRGKSVRVRLTRRLANYIDGVNLSAHHVGDVFDVTPHDGDLLLAEAWAVAVVPRTRPQSQTAGALSRADTEVRRFLLAGQLRNIGEQIQRRSFQPHDYRRADDLIRDEWHDQHANVLNDPDPSR